MTRFNRHHAARWSRRRVLGTLGAGAAAIAVAGGFVGTLTGRFSIPEWLDFVNDEMSRPMPGPGGSNETGACIRAICANFRLKDETGRYVGVTDGAPPLVIVAAGSTRSLCNHQAETISILSDAFAPYVRIPSYYIAMDHRVDTVREAARFRAANGLSTHVLTGTPDQIRTAAAQLKIHYALNAPGRNEHSIEHSMNVYVFDSRGRFKTALPEGLSTARKAAIIHGIIADAVSVRLGQGPAGAPIRMPALYTSRATRQVIGRISLEPMSLTAIQSTVERRESARKLKPCGAR